MHPLHVGLWETSLWDGPLRKDDTSFGNTGLCMAYTMSKWTLPLFKLLWTSSSLVWYGRNIQVLLWSWPGLLWEGEGWQDLCWQTVLLTRFEQESLPFTVMFHFKWGHSRYFHLIMSNLPLCWPPSVSFEFLGPQPLPAFLRGLLFELCVPSLKSSIMLLRARCMFCNWLVISSWQIVEFVIK